MAVPARTGAVDRESGGHQRVDRRRLADRTAVPCEDIEPADRAQGQWTLHDGLERPDDPRKIDRLEAGERREVPAVALRQHNRTALAEHEPRLRDAGGRDAAAVGAREREDAA